MRKRKAFTLIELMVVVAIIALLISILLPSLGQARESARKAKCLANLRGFGNSFKIYANSYDGKYPQIGVGGTLEDPGDSTASGVANSVDTVAALWVMIRSGNASPGVFICPSDGKATEFDEDLATYENAKESFPILSGELSLSYAYQIPQGGKLDEDNNNATKFAIMADRNPPLATTDFESGSITIGASEVLSLVPAANGATPEDAKTWLTALEDSGSSATATYKVQVNSPNHGGLGQNVLFQDGHAAWASHPWVGIRDDNIYTVQTSGGNPSDRIIGAAPAVTTNPLQNDSVLTLIEEGVKGFIKP